MKSDLFDLIADFDLDGLKSALAANPGLANEGVIIKLDGKVNPAKGHPLHRISDAVSAGKITDNQAIAIAKIFLEHGANINGFMAQGDRNTPLAAAAGLNAEELGMFYIEQGADIGYVLQGGGDTALHRAAYCGSDKLVEKLIEKGADVNRLDNTYHSTPCGWAIHVLESGETDDLRNQLNCVKLLLRAGTDQNLLYPGSLEYLRNLAETDPDLKILLD